MAGATGRVERDDISTGSNDSERRRILRGLVGFTAPTETSRRGTFSTAIATNGCPPIAEGAAVARRFDRSASQGLKLRLR